MELAAKIAVRTVARFLQENEDSFDLVEWVLFDSVTESVYEAEVDKLYSCWEFYPIVFSSLSNFFEDTLYKCILKSAIILVMKSVCLVLLVLFSIVPFNIKRVRINGHITNYTETKMRNESLILGFFFYGLKEKEMLNMAFNDWNHDGRKDWQDNYIEYQIYRDVTGNKNNSSYTPRNGISTFGAILSTIGGLFLGAGIVALFAGDNVEKVPVIITIILWLICSSVLAVFFDNNGV